MYSNKREDQLRPIVPSSYPPSLDGPLKHKSPLWRVFSNVPPPLSGKGMLITLIMKSLPCVKTEPRTSAWQFLSFVLCNFLCKHVQSDILLNVIIFGYLLQGLGTYSQKHTHKGDSHLEGMFHIRWEILVMISTIFGWFWVSRCWD